MLLISCLRYAVLFTGLQLKCAEADYCDHMTFFAGVASTVRENDVTITVQLRYSFDILQKQGIKLLQH